VARNESASITLKILAKDLASGKVGSFIGKLDALSKRGGIAGRMMQGVGMSMGMMLNPMVLASRGLGMVTDTLSNAVQASSDLAEAQSKTDEVFRGSSIIIEKWAQDASGAMGMSERAALEAASTLGNFLQAMGTSEIAATDMSMEVTALAADLASFNNTAGGAEAVLVALRSGLAGESEPMRRLGADVSAARVNAILLADGVQKVNGKFTESQKVVGRYKAIIKDTSKAQGDFKRTANGLANAARISDAKIENLNAAIGGTVDGFVGFAQQVGIAAVDALGAFGRAIDDIDGSVTRQRIASNALLTVYDKLADAYPDDPASVEHGMAMAEALIADKQAIDLLEKSLKKFGVGGATLDDTLLSMEYLADASGTSVADLADKLDMNLRQAVMNFPDLFSGDDMSDLHQLDVVIGEVTTSLVPMKEATEAAAEEASTLGEAVADEIIPGLEEWQDSAEATGSVVRAEFVSTANVSKEAVGTIISGLDDLGPGIKQTISDNKATVRQAMTDLRWAMEHPFAGQKYINFLKNKQTAANNKLNKALEAGKTQAAARAAAIYDAITAELTKLDGLSANVSVTMSVDPTTGRRRPGGAPGRASGGPVDAGRTYLVGERGPELLYMGTTPGNVTSNDKLGGTTVNINGGTFLANEEDTRRWAAALVPAIERERRRLAV